MQAEIPAIKRYDDYKEVSELRKEDFFPVDHSALSQLL